MVNKTTLNGISFENPQGWGDFKIKMNFGSNGMETLQPDLEIDSITFTGESAKYIKEFQELNGHFQKIYLNMNTSGNTTFDGFLSNINYLGDSDTVRAKVNDNEGLNNFSDRLGGVTCALLKDKYSYKTLLYQIEQDSEQEKKDLALLSLSTLTYSYILYQQTKQVNDYIIKVSTPDVIDPADILRTILEGVTLLASTVATSISLVKFAIKMKELILPTVRKAKVISLKELLVRPLERLGYTLQTNLEDLDNVYHWASRTANKKEYVPNSSDMVYNAYDLFAFILKKFNANIKIVDNVVYLYHEEDAFWKKDATENLEDISLNDYELNLDEHVSARETTYKEDYSERWTIEDYEGFQYMVTSNTADFNSSTCIGFEEINHNISLTSRKEKLNAIETTLETFINLHNHVVKIYGKAGENLMLNSRIGIAKISNKNFEVAKLVYLQGDKIPRNHRDFLSAKADEIKYNWSKSFVRNENRLRKNFTNRKIKFNLTKFRNILNNPYFKTVNGNLGKYVNIEWLSDRDVADCDFYVISPYKTNLIEEFTEINE